MKVLVAGANGAIGRQVVEQLASAGYNARAMVRRTTEIAGAAEVVVADALEPSSLSAAFDGVDAIVSTVGASVGLTLGGRASYFDVDVPANANLLRAAEQSGVGRFVYLGVHTGEGYTTTRYVQAHEQVVHALAASPLSYTTVRPVGVFTALNDFLDMARRGRAQIIGDGSAQTNPIHASDVARAVVENISDGPRDVSIGGPDIITRRQIAEIAFEALGKEAKISSVPVGMMKALASTTRVFHPRLGDLMEFATAVSVSEGIAPQYGRLRLIDYFRELAQQR